MRLPPRHRRWPLCNRSQDSKKRWESGSAPESAASRNAALPTDSESAITSTLRLCRGTCSYLRGVNRDVKRENRRFCGQPHSDLWRSFILKDGAIHDTLPLFRERGGQGLPCPKGAGGLGGRARDDLSCPLPRIVRRAGRLSTRAGRAPTRRVVSDTVAPVGHLTSSG